MFCTDPQESAEATESVLYAEPMNLPLQLPYNPTLKLIALPLGGGIAWLCLQFLLGPLTIRSFGFWFGVVTLTIGLLLAARRLFFRRFLVLGNDGLDLPSGLGRLRSVQIPYAAIRQIRHTRLLWMSVLRVATNNGTFEILSGMLPDTASYIEVANLLNAAADTKRNPSHPDPTELPQ